MEYAVLVGIVLAAVLSMQVYLRRSIQASLKVAADQIGDQANGLRYESGDFHLHEWAPGTLLESRSVVDTTERGGQDLTLLTQGHSVRRAGNSTSKTEGKLGGAGQASTQTVLSELNPDP